MLPTIFILVLLIPILAIVLDSPVGRALAGRLERKGLGEPPDMMAERPLVASRIAAPPIHQSDLRDYNPF